MTAKSKLLRSGIITASFTFLSRILGMFRDIAIASLLGASLASDIFFFANRIPNFFRRLFAEGAFSQSFVPVMTETKNKNDPKKLKDLISATAGTLGAIVFFVSILGMLLSPVLTAIFGWGWFNAWLNNESDGYKFIEASYLLQITFPYLFFITLTALTSAILNIYGNFAIPAATPCLLNIVMILAAYFVAPSFSDPNTVLAYAMVVGGIVQLIFQIPFIIKLKLLVLPKFSWKNPGVCKIRKLMLPAIFGVSASQLNLLINSALATFLATGSISYLYYSDRLLEFPIGIFAVAISTVILPALSKVKFQEDHDTYEKTLDWAVRLVLFLGIPSMCGIIALRELILRVIFMRGAFTSDHVLLSSSSLLASVSGLCAIMLVRVLVQGFAAIQDTKTPVKCGVIAIIANIIFNLILIIPLSYVGLALSTALAAFVNASLLLFKLKQRNIYTLRKTSLIFIVKCFIAAIIMAFVVRYACPYFDSFIAMSTFESAIYLSVLIALGAVVYIVSLFILGFRLNQIKM